MTQRCFYVVLVFVFGTSLNAQFYRVFYKPDQLQTATEFAGLLKNYCDSVWMSSEWLNYSLVQKPCSIGDIEDLSFVDHLEKVEAHSSFAFNTITATGKSPNDSHRQWQIDTLGYPYFRSQNINGSGIVIAVIDAGFTSTDESRGFTHLFSENKIIKTWDFIDNDSDVYHGSTHGTGVLGCIAGNMDNKPTGLATGASFILLRSEDQKTETMADEDRWIQAIEKAYEWGADIVTSSIGFTNMLHKKNEVNGQSLISKAATIAAEKGMVVIISAGNEYITNWKTLAVPADADKVIAVGGIDRDGNQSYFSSVGPTFDGRSKPDVVAPGTCVTINGNSFVTVSGTSFATPLVAGYVACMMQLHGKKNFTADSVKRFGGLYPYFDNVFGSGVPGPVKPTLGLGKLRLHYIPDKEKNMLIRRSRQTGLKFTDIKNAFFKIVDEKGNIKFSKKLNISKGANYKIPVYKTPKPFTPGKYYDPQPTDKWYIWWEGALNIF